MGFFKDFKEDLSQAVNELVVPEATLEGQDVAEEDVIVNTLDEEESLLSEMSAMIEKEANDEEVLTEEVFENSVTEETVEVLESDREFSESGTYSDEEVLDETAIITKGLNVIGDLNSRGSIDLFGAVQGNVCCKGKLTISGLVTGDSEAAEVFANNARINGNIESKGTAKIGQGTVVVGNVVATSAVIAGAVKGDIDVKGPVIIDASAVIVGDIKSKSVQINNGAVIDGRCSQTYAEINTTSIFGV